MMDNTYYILYLTLNTINMKRYIGYHATKNKNDGYLGSGTILSKAIEKYGKSSFVRFDLEYYDNEKEARAAEQSLLESLDAANDKTYYNVKNTSIGFNSEDATRHWNNYYASSLYTEERKVQKSKAATLKNSLETATFKNSNIQKELSKRAQEQRRKNIKENPEKYSEYGRRGAAALSYEDRKRGGEITGKMRAESGALKEIAGLGGKATKGMGWYTNTITGASRRFREAEVPSSDWIRGRKKC